MQIYFFGVVTVQFFLFTIYKAVQFFFTKLLYPLPPTPFSANKEQVLLFFVWSCNETIETWQVRYERTRLLLFVFSAFSNNKIMWHSLALSVLRYHSNTSKWNNLGMIGLL